MKTTVSHIIGLLVLLLGACQGSKTSSDVVQLKLNLENGKAYIYATNTHLDMTVKGMATGLNMAYTYKLMNDSKDSAGNQVLLSTIDALKFKAEAMGMSMGYDSKEVIDTNHQDGMSRMVRSIFSGMLGKSFKVTVSPTGNIEKVTGVEEIVAAMIDGIPGSEEDKARMRQTLQQSFNPLQVKQTFAQAFNIYPDKPVKVGDTWNKDLDLGMAGMKSKQQIIFKVKDITASSVILDLKGELKSSMKPPTDSTDASASTNMTGSENGTMTIDRTSGLATSGDLDLNVKGSVNMKGTAMPMDIKGKITISNK